MLNSDVCAGTSLVWMRRLETELDQEVYRGGPVRALVQDLGNGCRSRLVANGDI